MSYVDLKHLLADLTLEALQHPSTVPWAAIAAAYAELARTDRPQVPWTAVRTRAAELGARLGWQPNEAALDLLLRAGLLQSDHATLTVRSSFIPHLAYMRRQTARLLDVLWRLREPRLPASQPDAVVRGTALFNSGLFFECHEFLEGVWKSTTGAAKNFYHGIVQIAAAFYHLEKGNLHGARTLLGKGLRHLDPYPSVYQGVTLGALRSALEPWVAHCRSPKEYPAPERYPTINLVTSDQMRN